MKKSESERKRERAFIGENQIEFDRCIVCFFFDWQRRFHAACWKCGIGNGTLGRMAWRLTKSVRSLRAVFTNVASSNVSIANCQLASLHYIQCRLFALRTAMNSISWKLKVFFPLSCMFVGPVGQTVPRCCVFIFCIKYTIHGRRRWAECLFQRGQTKILNSVLVSFGIDSMPHLFNGRAIH